MTDHQAFVADLPGDVRAALTARSDRAGLWHLAGHVGAIVATGALIATGVPGWWALLPVQGGLVIFLFSLEHEATHKTPFASLWLNEWVGRLCGFVLVLPFEWFRYFHLAHHRWTNIEGRDPELAGAKARIVAEARWMAVAYAVVAVSLIWSPVVIWVWLVPVLLGQPVLRLYLLAEHGDCPQVANMFENTRTTFSTALVRFLAWNMPYHVEHHVYPAVPFHHLPALHGLMRDELRVTADGYAAFTRAYLARRR
jgi:fatty acid desaturase